MKHDDVMKKTVVDKSISLRINMQPGFKTFEANDNDSMSERSSRVCTLLAPLSLVQHSEQLVKIYPAEDESPVPAHQSQYQGKR